MASIVLGVVGAGIGAFFGGPQGAALGWSAGVTLAGIVFPPKLGAQERGRIDDTRVTGSGYGAMIPQVWGKARVGGNILWATDLVERKHKENVGGKGGATAEVTTYTYFANLAVAVCAGPVDRIERIWADDLLIYDHKHGVNEVQKVDVFGTLLGDDFTLTFMGDTTATLSYGVSPEDLEAALEALPSIGAGNVTVRRVLLSYYVTFQNDLGNQDVPQMTINPGIGVIASVSTKTQGKGYNTKYDIVVHLGGEDMEPSEFIEAHEGVGNVPAYRGLCYVTFNMLPLKKFGGRVPVFSFEVKNGESVTVADVIEDVLPQVGLASSQFNASGGDSSTFVGWILSSRQSARDFLEPLFQAYSIDLVEYGGKIRVVARGGAVDMTIDPADLGCSFYEESNAIQTVDVKRIQDWELPNEVDVTFFNSEKKYEQDNQSAVRYCKSHVHDKLTVTLPACLTNTQARRMATRLLYEQWREREQFAARLPLSYLKLVPGSVVALPVGDSVLRARVVGLDLALFGPIETTFVLDDEAVISQIIDGSPASEDEEDVFSPETTLFYPFSSNALRDTDADSVGFYVAIAGGSAWEGASIFKSNTGGDDYLPILNVTRSATWGTALTELGPGTTTGAIDNTLTVDVHIEQGDIETTSLNMLLAGDNAALLGNEVIQFLSVEALGDDKYRLSGLLRGQRGTDYQWSNHAAGDVFILLDDSIVRVDLNRSMKAKTIYLKAVADAQTLDDAEPVPLVISANELKPYSPVQIRGERDGSDNLTITWVRRARKDGEMQDGADVALDESYERYKVEIYDSTYTTLKRTISGLTSESATYTAAQQTTDFGSHQAQVYVKVYQLGDFKPGTTDARTTGHPGKAVV
jgi:hypothetical protein